MRLLLVLIIFPFSSFANNKGGYDVALINSIALTLEKINEDKKEYCSDISTGKIDTSLYNNCSNEEVNKITDRQFKAYGMIESWLTKIRGYEKLNILKKEKYTIKRLGGKVKIKKERSMLTNTIKTLQCISNKINYIGFQCRSQDPICLYEAWAATKVLWLVVDVPFHEFDIHLCTSFWRGEQAEIGMIIHELAHHCGATDATYFNSTYEPPRTFEKIHWSRIADTYEYWAEFGFCIPGIDCE